MAKDKLFITIVAEFVCMTRLQLRGCQPFNRKCGRE